MSNVWDTLILIKNDLIDQISQTGMSITEPGMTRFNKPGWVNMVWTGPKYRRAHIDVVDARSNKGLWMMHCCIFPHTHSDAPIFGFDVIAGENKITGCFYDFSSSGAGRDHEMSQWFANHVTKYQWKRTRELPDWAAAIFSDDMVAAGNVQSDEELIQIMEMAQNGIAYYLDNVGKFNNKPIDNTDNQNRYGYYQKQNPHTPRVMASLGLDPDDVREFIDHCLFPELSGNSLS